MSCWSEACLPLSTPAVVIYARCRRLRPRGRAAALPAADTERVGIPGAAEPAGCDTKYLFCMRVLDRDGEGVVGGGGGGGGGLRRLSGSQI